MLASGELRPASDTVGDALSMDAIFANSAVAVSHINALRAVPGFPASSSSPTPLTGSSFPAGKRVVLRGMDIRHNLVGRAATVVSFEEADAIFTVVTDPWPGPAETVRVLEDSLGPAIFG